MTDLLRPRWCTYCRKDNHNDSECWSTRPAGWLPGPGCPMPWSLTRSEPDYRKERHAFEMEMRALFPRSFRQQG